MSAEVARALIVPGLGPSEPLEHVTWGGELPTWEGTWKGLGRLARRSAAAAKEIRPEQAFGAIVVTGAAIATVAALSALGAENPEDLLTAGAQHQAPARSRLGFLLASTPARLILLEVHRAMVDRQLGRGGVRTLVVVHSAFWWNRPIAPSVPVRMRDQRVLWKQAMALTFRDDGVERRLLFPVQPGMPTNLAEARGIATTCFG